MNAVSACVVVALVALLLGVVAGRVTRRRAPSGPPEPPRSDADGLPALVIEALRHGVVVLDRDERAMLANPRARAMGVLSGDQLVNATLAGLARTALESGAPTARLIDLPTGRLAREPLAVAATAVPLPLPDARGRASAVALLLDDVTEQRRLEDVRRDFVANVSHELKTPVGALTLLAEAVQDAADDQEAVARFASRMQHEGARLGRLVRELIELSRLQGAEPLPGADPVPVGDVLDEAADRTRMLAEQAGIGVVVRYAPDLYVPGNETQLTTAVVNLVDNAIAYSPSGTRIALNARAGTGSDGTETVEISVSDQGIGIAETDIDRVFERFYRVDPARSRATGGTGLGLAIVKHVAANHGGEVAVWSSEGAGSTFTIRLPRVHDDGPRSARPTREDRESDQTPGLAWQGSNPVASREASA